MPETEPPAAADPSAASGKPPPAAKAPPAGKAAPAEKAAAPAKPPAPPKDPRDPAMREHFARVQSEQRRLGWDDAKLCEFATKALATSDPYGRLKVTTIDFASRLRPTLLKSLAAALAKER